MIAQSLQEFVGGFDFQRAAEQHLRYRRHTEVRHPDGRVETTVEIVESALGAFRRLESGLPRAGEWAALRSPLEQATLALHPSTWPTVLVDVGSPQNVTRWLEAGPDGSGLGFSDNEPRFADIFRVFSDFRPGLTLARFGLVAVRVPPSSTFSGGSTIPNWVWTGSTSVTNRSVFLLSRTNSSLATTSGMATT